MFLRRVTGFVGKGLIPGIHLRKKHIEDQVKEAPLATRHDTWDREG